MNTVRHCFCLRKSFQCVWVFVCRINIKLSIYVHAKFTHYNASIHFMINLSSIWQWFFSRNFLAVFSSAAAFLHLFNGFSLRNLQSNLSECCETQESVWHIIAIKKWIKEWSTCRIRCSNETFWLKIYWFQWETHQIERHWFVTTEHFISFFYFLFCPLATTLHMVRSLIFFIIVLCWLYKCSLNRWQLTQLKEGKIG